MPAFRMQETFDVLSNRLKMSGLRILHSGPALDQWPDKKLKIKNILIIGHRGSEFWPYFKASPEFFDDQPNPLDRWSKRIIEAAAPDLRFVSPSDGPPYPPLHALTQNGALHPSPLGMLVHADFGLWIAVRGILLSTTVFPHSVARKAPPQEIFDRCFEACPVQAFSQTGYAAETCAPYLLDNPSGDCWSGCRARRACTLGAHDAYNADQARFYMDTFTKAMQKRGL